MTEAEGQRPATALVLGARVLAGGQPSVALKRRALQAARLYRDGKVGRIVASGGPPGARPTEAEVIRSLCLTAGVPDGAILLESEAATTEENIRFSLPLVPPGTRLWLVTDRYHAPRAALAARAHGLEPTLCCPAPTGTGRRRLARLWLRELPALAYYAWRFRRRPRPVQGETVTSTDRPTPPDP